jgi:Tol biopolymer transport system component
MKGTTMRVAATAVVVVLAVLGAAASAHAAFSGHNGRIVFQSNRTGNADIYTMNPDGSNRVQLTTTPSEDVDPRWSPDGMRIAFASDRTGIFQIYTMNADGTDVRQLTTLLGHNRRPSWTADGRILFHSDVDDPAQARDIFVMNADGSGVTNLTNTPGGDDAYATASPRGSKIVFSSDRFGGYGLFLLNGNAPPRQLTSGGNDFEANWSPSGNELVFVRFDPTFTTSDLYLVHVDGSGLVQQLTNTPDRIEYEPAWSPDGTLIVFHSCDPAFTHCVNNVMNADGSGEADVSTPRIPYLDTFDAPQIDPFWGQPFVQGNGPTISQTNGELEVGVPGTTTNDPSLGYVTAGVNTQCRLNGDFDVQVDYRLLQWPPLPEVNVDFGTFSQANGGFEGYGLFVFDPGGLGTGISTGFPGPVNTYVPDASPAGTLRFARAGDTLTAYRLVSGAWVPIQSIADTQTDVGVSLNVFSNAAPGTHGDVKIAYDNFRITNGRFTCPTWWGDNAPDWQAS